jgi:hypothetical protein
MTVAEAKKRQIFTKKAIMRRGTIKRLAGGIIVMDFIEADDPGTAPEIFLTGLCKVERLSPNTVRLSWYTRQADGNLVTLKTILDIQEWLAVQDPLIQARSVIARLPMGDGSRRKEAH